MDIRTLHPDDQRIITVALRRMAILSDEPPATRERADKLADLVERGE